MFIYINNMKLSVAQLDRVWHERGGKSQDVLQMNCYKSNCDKKKAYLEA